MPFSGNDKTSKPRHRASVACKACRERRTKCVVRGGEGSCTQCMDAGQECIIKNDDQRRKPVSKAYVSLLQDKVNQLEAALREKEEPPPTADQEQSNNGQADSTDCRGNSAQHAQPEFTSTDFALPTLSAPGPTSSRSSSVSAGDPGAGPGRTASSGSPGDRKPPMVHRLLSTRGHVSFDQLAGRLRYFGPTTNCHIYSDIAAESDESRRQTIEQDRRTQRVLSALPQETHDYLMDLFWQYYNSVIHVIHRGAFEEGKDAGAGPFYSGFLHVCILATGYRFADKQRPEMVRITLPGRESTLHREAKYMVDYEIERPGGIPSIGALLLLGDLEVGCGRDNVGWLYSGMAYRLCIDAGLHLDRSDSGLSEKDVEIGRMMLWACVIYDRYWALFLGRPTALKPNDLEAYELSRQFDRMGIYQLGGPEKTLETQIYQALFEVMELAGRIMDNVSNSSGEFDRHAYLRMAALDRDIEKWYARLPLALQYTAANVKTAPFSFFLLHQQYYSALILLHRQFAHYDDSVDGKSQRTAKDRDSTAAATHLSALSRSTCTTCAGRIAQIFWQHRQRFDTRKIFVTGIQHAGNAAMALVAAIASSTEQAANDKNMRYLECLTAVLNDMSETYQPAERMATLLNAVRQDLRELHPNLKFPSSVPARRGSSADCQDEPVFDHSKRSPSSRPRANAHERQSTSYPDNQFRKLSKTVLPSPAPTSQSTSEKLTGYGVSNEDLAVIGGDIANVDDPWFLFGGPNPFAMEDNTAGQASPPAFRPVGACAETFSFSPLVNGSIVEPGNTNASFMTLPKGPDRTAQNTGLHSGANGMPVISSSGAGVGIPSSAGGLSQGTIHDSDLGASSPSCDRIRGYQPAKGRPSNETNYTEMMARPDSIWNEIIS